METLESTIDAVQVYHRGATITRRARLALVDGAPPAEVALGGLPLSLSDASVRLRVEVEGDRPAPLVATGLRVSLLAPAPEAPLDAPDEAALRRVRREIARVVRQRELLEDEIALLEAMAVPERPEGDGHGPPPPSPLETRLALEAFSDGAVRKRLDARVELEETLRRLEEEAAALEDAVRRADAASRVDVAQVRKVVVATLRAVAGDPDAAAAPDLDAVTLVLDYFVPGARWAPAYQCQIERAGERAILQQRALVVQQSGEDWRGVRLWLSTAAPQRWSALPELAAIRIGKTQPAPPSQGLRPPPQGAGALFDDHDQALQRLSRRFTRSEASAAPPRRPTRAEPSSSSPLRERLQRRPRRAEEGRVMLEREGDAGVAAPAPQAASFGASAPRASMPAPAPPPAPGAARKRAAPRGAGGAGPRGGERLKAMASLEEAAFDEADEATEAGEAQRSLDAPRFMTLRLEPAEDPERRGRLHPASARDAHLELLRRASLEVDVDVERLVQRAQEHAAAAAHAPLSVDVRAAAGRFDHAYETAHRVDVPADGVIHSVPVDSREAPCEMRYVVVPRVERHVYRQASIANPSPEPLLEGSVEVYIGGEYVLTGRLPTVAPGERFSLGLGVEQAIRCARNARFDEQRSGQAVVATAELRHRVEVELVNDLPRAVEVEVRERIPQPAPDAEVVVHEREVSPPWTPYDQRELGHGIVGGRRWTARVEPGATRTLRAEYVVEIYANNELVGGNRREA